MWDLPDAPPPIGIAVSGPRSCRLAGRHADVMIAVEPRIELGEMFDDAGGAGKPRIGSDRVVVRPRSADRGEARDGAVPLVHRQLEGQRRAAGAGVVRRRIEDSARGGRVQADALRSRRRPPRGWDTRVRATRGSPTSRRCRSVGRPRSSSSPGRRRSSSPPSERGRTSDVAGSSGSGAAPEAPTSRRGAANSAVMPPNVGPMSQRDIPATSRNTIVSEARAYPQTISWRST